MTPHALPMSPLAAAPVTRAAARAATAIQLLEEAMHLRTQGENAPGGHETWREWDRRTETFLRSLTPPEETR